MKRAMFFIALTLVTPMLFGFGQARLTGRVLDVLGQPLKGATVTVTATVRPIARSVKTDEKGDYVLMVLDATMTYEVAIEKEGLTAFRTTSKFAMLPEENVIDVFLGKTASIRRMPAIEDVRNDAIAIYNEAVAAADRGDLNASAAKFAEVLGIDPKLDAARIGLMKTHMLREQWSAAIDIGESMRAAGVADPEVEELLETSRAVVRLASDPTPRAQELYVRAMQKINEGDDEEVQSLLRKALELNPDLAAAHFQLAMWLLGKGIDADAVVHLRTYLRLAPAGEHAAEARTLLRQLK